MNNLDQLMQRNREFAAKQSAEGALMPSLPRALPNVKAIVIGCADMRVDPAHVLGIKPGEAVVLRNIGGRVTPGLFEQMGMLHRIGEVAGEAPGGGGEFHLIVLQHTDCGITRLPGDPAMLAHYFQIPEGELKTKAVSDPRAALAVDVAALRAIPALPGNWIVSGSCTTWRLDLWRSWYRLRRFVLRNTREYFRSALQKMDARSTAGRPSRKSGAKAEAADSPLRMTIASFVVEKIPGFVVELDFRIRVQKGTGCSDISLIPRYTRITRHLVDIGVPAEKEVIQ